ncbi:ROK family transcriptional regulator [Lentilitoribacter sp. Alg239-R112]|uniref:ROK family transcriptional regulator n=1 Tax=Lentilitoribacter sp. Alg239-R112 TaxID=2305987 RepID=UPI0013A68F43|nr:ROK family transcriptional regulator [Lentilitoribacter sp. Alg239-R112]
MSQIQANPGVSRAELARMCGFSEMAATRIVRELLAVRIVEEFDIVDKTKTKKKNVGRPKIGLRIVKSGLFAVGITVSAYHSEVSICDADGELFASSRSENLSFENVEDAARFYANALRELIETSEIDVDRIVGVGVALSARTLPDAGEIVTSEYFGWANDGGRFCREIQQIINLPVQIENIANALAIAEMRFGVARKIADFALIHVATFVGAGMVSERRLVRGDSGISGLLGHFRAEERPLTCVCGRHDCLNLSATGFGLLSKMGKLDHQAFDTSKLSFYADSLLAALENDKVSDLVTEAGEKLAPALDSVAKLLGPKMIILSGYLGANDRYIDGVMAMLAQQFDHDPETSFQLTKGTISSVESAALLALHSFCYSDRFDYDRFARTIEQSEEIAHG